MPNFKMNSDIQNFQYGQMWKFKTSVAAIKWKGKRKYWTNASECNCCLGGTWTDVDTEYLIYSDEKMMYVEEILFLFVNFSELYDC